MQNFPPPFSPDVGHPGSRPNQKTKPRRARLAVMLAAAGLVLSGCQVVVTTTPTAPPSPEVEQLLTTNVCEGCYLRLASLSRLDLSNARLSRADLTMARLIGTILVNADLSRADLDRARMQGAVLVGANLEWADLDQADLSGANLSGTILNFADLPDADLSNADLSGADLTFGDFYGVSFRFANLQRADLFAADFDNNTDFTGANLFRASGIRQSELAEAITCRTILPNGEIDNTDCPVAP